MSPRITGNFCPRGACRRACRRRPPRDCKPPWGGGARGGKASTYDLARLLATAALGEDPDSAYGERSQLLPVVVTDWNTAAVKVETRPAASKISSLMRRSLGNPYPKACKAIEHPTASRCCTNPTTVTTFLSKPTGGHAWQQRTLSRPVPSRFAGARLSIARQTPDSPT